MKEIIKNIIADFQKREFPAFVDRDITIPLRSKKIVTIIGPRRAGKTYLMYQLISQVEDKTNVIYFNFEDERLHLEGKDLGLIIEAFLEFYPEKKEKDIYLFFDEIQEIPGWEKFIRRIYDTFSTNIFITGSSAKLLSREIATSLRGRTLTYELFPLSFKEFLKFRNMEKDIYSTKGKAQIKHEFKDYMVKGGFPEITAMEKGSAEKTLSNYFEVMLYRDIAERHHLKNVLPLKEFVKFLLSNISKEFSINKIFNSFKSRGLTISKDSLYKYLEYCSDAFVLLPITNFSESFNAQNARKSYSIDHGLSQTFSFSLSSNKGIILENIVLVELRRRGLKIYFYKNSRECDFVVQEKDQIIQAIQVCFELNDENREREVGGLNEAIRRFKLKEGIILTNDQEEKQGNIKVIPLWKWLLEP